MKISKLQKNKCIDACPYAAAKIIMVNKKILKIYFEIVILQNFYFEFSHENS